MIALQEPFRYDYVGSFLRPEKVKNAKALYEDGKIEKEELDETINEAIREVVAKQKDLGFHVITDGEFNPDFHNAVMHVEDDSVGENIVVEEFEKGYTYRDQVIRHSMVKVAN